MAWRFEDDCGEVNRCQDHVTCSGSSRQRVMNTKGPRESGDDQENDSKRSCEEVHCWDQ